MFLQLNNFFATVDKIHKKQRPSVRRQFIFIIFCQSQGQIFLTRFLGKAFLGGQQLDFLSLLCFVRCLLLPFFLIYFYIAVSYLREELCDGPTFAQLLQKLERDLKGRYFFFRDYYVFVTKIGKTGTS